MLKSFVRAAKLQVNLSKSKIVYSKWLPQSTRHGSIFKEGLFQVKYLGIPLYSKRVIRDSRSVIISRVIEKVKKKKLVFLV